MENRFRPIHQVASPFLFSIQDAISLSESMRMFINDRKVSLFWTKPRTHCLNWTFPIQDYKKVNFLLDDFVFDRVEAHKKRHHTHTKPGRLWHTPYACEMTWCPRAPSPYPQSNFLTLSFSTTLYWHTAKGESSTPFLHDKLFISQLYMPRHRQKNPEWTCHWKKRHVRQVNC